MSAASPPKPPRYHQLLLAHLRRHEPELLEWFADASRPSDQEVADVELSLLKTAYRMEGGIHDVLVAEAALLSARMFEGVADDVAVTLYQALDDDERNARTMVLGDGVHIVFSGDLLDLLDPDEQRAVLAHELAHALLLLLDQRDYLALDHMVHRLDGDADAPEGIAETARRLRLHTEVWADAAASRVVDSADAMIAAVVKTESGLRNVEPAAYVRQAQQILDSDSSASQAWTHPELHLRVAALVAHAAPDADGVVAALVEGPDDLDRLDLLGQLRVQRLTAGVLSGGRQALAAGGEDTGAAETHLAAFGLPPEDAPADDALAEAQPSVQHLAAACLLDLALADAEEQSTTGLSVLAREASRIGVGKEFDRLLARETEHTLTEIRRLREAAP